MISPKARNMVVTKSKYWPAAGRAWRLSSVKLNRNWIAYVVLPFAIQFLFSFTDESLQAHPAAGQYFDFVTTMFLAFGLVMEFPILLVGLSTVGIVTSARLTSSRRMVILGIAIFAAVVTPGGDLVSPFVLGGTMYLLYELTILFIRRSGK